jgi:hypothetical protein
VAVLHEKSGRLDIPAPQGTIENQKDEQHHQNDGTSRAGKCFERSDRHRQHEQPEVDDVVP